MNTDNQPAGTEPSIFEDITLRDDKEYRKAIKNARTSLFVIAGFQLVYAVVMALISGDETVRIISVVFGVVLAAIFTGLGFYSNKKPFIALVIGLSVYSLLLIIDIIADPSSIAKGIFIKGLIIVWLVKGVMKAKQMEEFSRISRQ